MPFVYAFFAWIGTTAVVATVTGNDGIGMVAGVAAGLMSGLAARRRARRDGVAAAAQVVEGLQAFAENIDPVPAQDPTQTTDIPGGVLRCFDRETSPLGLAAFDNYRTNWMTRSDVSPHNPLVARSGLAASMLYGADRSTDSSGGFMVAYGMGYAVGMAERADKLRLDDSIVRPWQEVMGLAAMILHQNPVDPDAPIPLHLIVQTVACGFYFGRTGQQPSLIQLALDAMDRAEASPQNSGAPGNGADLDR